MGTNCFSTLGQMSLRTSNLSQMPAVTPTPGSCCSFTAAKPIVRKGCSGQLRGATHSRLQHPCVSGSSRAPTASEMMTLQGTAQDEGQQTFSRAWPCTHEDHPLLSLRAKAKASRPPSLANAAHHPRHERCHSPEHGSRVHRRSHENVHSDVRALCYCLGEGL